MNTHIISKVQLRVRRGAGSPGQIYTNVSFGLRDEKQRLLRYDLYGNKCTNLKIQPIWLNGEMHQGAFTFTAT